MGKDNKQPGQGAAHAERAGRPAVAPKSSTIHGDAGPLAYERASSWALEPRHLEARVNRGNALAMLERLDDAIADYDAALGRYPGHAGASFNRGNACDAHCRRAGAHGERARARLNAATSARETCRGDLS